MPQIGHRRYLERAWNASVALPRRLAILGAAGEGASLRRASGARTCRP
jgi:hypothetical protein